MIQHTQTEQHSNEQIEHFKSQVRDENLILRFEQMEQENIYEVFQAYTLYEKIYE